MSRLLISAAHKSSGKTTITTGLCAALSAQGLRVQPFKKGPDYIDPMWLAQASGRDCFNLDPYLTDEAHIKATFGRYAAAADISIVEGNKGLYDGLALDGSNSNAALAHWLDLPVVLVLDARGMTRGIAPLILGYQAFDSRLHITGVILNQLGGARHESKLRAVIEHYTDVAVLGAVAHDPQLAVMERHLGLMPSHEARDPAQIVQTIGQRIAAQVDLPQLLRCATATAPLPAQPGTDIKLASQAASLRIGVARDKAFGFYYPDDLQTLADCGAGLVFFDTLHDRQLPDVDGLFIGGGFPEVFMEALSANVDMRHSIRTAIDNGLPVYAECGGLMYLARSLNWNGQTCDMVGAIAADVEMHPRPVGRGYVTLQSTTAAPWPCAIDGAAVRGHEFHYSNLVNVHPDTRFAFKVTRGHGVDGVNDGIVHRNVLASYAHLRTGAGSDWARSFVDFVRSINFRKTAAGAGLLSPYWVSVKGQPIATDSEGYLLQLADWSEDFALARAQIENLELTSAHWEVIHFLRAYHEEHQVQPQVRSMIKHFTQVWGVERGNNHHLHAMFPVGGPQKQGNRLAGLWKTKGEH